MKKESNDQSSKEYIAIHRKTETIQTELEKLKSEMLQKIKDIHQLEQELVIIEGHSSLDKNKLDEMDITNNALELTSNVHRNEEVMAEIRTMLKDMVQPTQVPTSSMNITISKDDTNTYANQHT